MNSLFKTVTESSTARSAKGEKVVSLRTSVEGTQEIFIKDLVLDMSIGVYETEKQNKQRVIANVKLSVKPNDNWQEDDIGHVCPMRIL